jgi:hypothetical protein
MTTHRRREAAAFSLSAALFGAGALLAVLLLPSRRKLEELRNTEPTASPGPADSPALTDSVPAGDGIPG